MARCLFCDQAAAVGALCTAHAEGLVGCTDITAGQIIGRPMSQPMGWLVDQWGRTHALAQTTLIGRDHEQCALAVMHHSVSARHARIELDGKQAQVRDAGSLNGTCVNQTRIREARLLAGDRLGLGDVAFYFTTRAAPHSELPHGLGGTVPTRASSLLLAVRLDQNGHSAELRQRVGGGLIRSAHGSLDLAPLEFALLRALIEKVLGAGDPDMQFVSTQLLLRALDFRTLDPSGENLRELVRRLRRKLQQIGMDHVIESKRGVGYRLSWSVERIDDS